MGRIEKAVRLLGNRLRSSVVILLYHRVASLVTDPYVLAVTPEHFAQHLDVLRKRYCVISLKELLDAIDQKRLPRNAVVITFDDGYADNFHNAKPLLESHNVSATMFIATGSIDMNREFWWDELEQILLRPGVLPDVLQLKNSGQVQTWRLRKGGEFSESDFEQNASWNLASPTDPSDRHVVLRGMWRLLHSVVPEKRSDFLNQLRSWAGTDGRARPTHPLMTRNELRELESSTVEIGAHTVNHPSLACLPKEHQHREISESKDYLEKCLGHKVTAFSYPFGSASDFSEDTIELVRQNGFVCACTNQRGIVRSKPELYRLPRVLVPDMDGQKFAHQIKRYFLDIN
jgi:peptidoglycan/xylan/chitin deacetylase (PgdA/CDA1 family)